MSRVPRIVLWTCVLACVAYVYSCAAVARVWDTASGHVVQIGIGAAAGLALGAVTGGVSLLPIVAASVAASTATLLATPPCDPVVIQAPPNPIAASIQWILVGAGAGSSSATAAHPRSDQIAHGEPASSCVDRE